MLILVVGWYWRYLCLEQLPTTAGGEWDDDVAGASGKVQVELCQGQAAACGPALAGEWTDECARGHCNR